MSAEPLLLTIEETAKALAISERSVHNLLSAGELPRKKIGRCTRIPRKAVERFADGEYRRARR